MTISDEKLAELERLAVDVRRGCPICGGPLTHDEVDNGVGMQQCGPDGCDQCQIVIGEWDAPPIEPSPAFRLGREVPALVAEIYAERRERAQLDADLNARLHDLDTVRAKLLELHADCLSREEPVAWEMASTVDAILYGLGAGPTQEGLREIEAKEAEARKVIS